MILVTSGGGRKLEHELSEKICHYMVKKLLPRVRNLTVYVDFQKNLEESEGIIAYAMDLNDRCFEIGVDKELMTNHGIREFTSALCHEMVHVKQYLRGELRYLRGKELWKGRDCTDMEYMEQPWEKEAYEVQDELALTIWNEIL